MPAPTLAASPTRKVSQLLMRGEGSGEQRRERGDRAVHQAGQTRLNNLQQEQPFLLRRFGFAELGQGDSFGSLRVAAFLLGEVPEQLPDPGVGRAASGDLVKPLRFHLHGLGRFLDGFQAERSDRARRGGGPRTRARPAAE